MNVKRYRNFLDYWDSRFDENEKILNSYPQLANFTFRECNRLWDHIHSDYAAIEEERDKLAREVMRLVNINEQLHEHHNALREAVAKMFAAHEAWTQKGGASYPDWADGRARYDSARAEVDRLLKE